MTLESIDPAILGPAFAAGLLVLATHVPLGREVLARGIIFIDLAVAQIAGLGVIAAALAGLDPHGFAGQAVAAGAALAGAALLHQLERRFGEQQEALIGVAFVLAATGGMLLLAHDPHGAEQLKELLAGQILWVGPAQLIPAALATALLLAAWFVPLRSSGRLRFYLVFALAVTVSVQLVGVYLVFASLILPALMTRRLPPGRALAAGWGVGAAAYAVGLALSALFDLPSGPLIVWVVAALALPVGWLLSVPEPGGRQPSAAGARCEGAASAGD